MSATAAPVRLPTPEQMKAYADELPEAYRRVLTAVQAANPERSHGETVYLYDVMSALAEMPPPRPSSPLVHQLVQRLREGGFFDGEPESPALRLTEMGEELLVAVTGIRTRPVDVPPLPAPKW